MTSQTLYRNKGYFFTMKSRKAQATGVATFMVVLALFMLAYILLLPEETREELIDISSTSSSSSSSLVNNNNYDYSDDRYTLLFTSPGEVFPYQRNEIIIPISPVSIYAKTVEDVQELATKITVSKSWFSDETKTLSFLLDDIDSLEELQLFFFVNKGEGNIFIKFNGNTVFEGEISSGDSPINLPIGRARRSNIIQIGMLSGDFAGDGYTLSSISVKKTERSAKSSEVKRFQISSGEKAGLKKAKLSYFVNCRKIDPKKQGELQLYLNSRELSTENVVCDAGTRSQTVSPGYFKSGTNIIEFRVSKGEYDIQGIEFVLETKDKYFPQYNFELDDEYYDEIKNGDKELFIEFKFQNDNDRKKAAVTINENQINFDTVSDSYKRKISSYVERGMNYIKIVPRIEFKIKSLRVYLDNKD